MKFTNHKKKLIAALEDALVSAQVDEIMGNRVNTVELTIGSFKLTLLNTERAIGAALYMAQHQVTRTSAPIVWDEGRYPGMGGDTRPMNKTPKDFYK